jgi:hypothetical protein
MEKKSQSRIQKESVTEPTIDFGYFWFEYTVTDKEYMVTVLLE